MSDNYITLSEKIDRFINKHETFCVIMMMITASIILCHSFFTVFPLHTTKDELGAIVGAALWAGYDWSGIIDRGAYYGFGYYSLFAPLFKLKLSPVIIYRIVLIVTRILRGSLISLIAYYIGKHYYMCDLKLKLMMLSIICTIPLHANDDANIINDVVLDIFFWIVILCLCKIVENMEYTRKCIKWIVIYLIAIFWCTFIHTRAIIIIIASFLILLGLLLYERKVKILITAGIVPVIVIIGRILVKAYQNKIWLASGKSLANASVYIADDISILDGKIWRIWFDILLGNIVVQILLTGGLFLLSVIVMIKYIYLLVSKKQEQGTIYTGIVFAVSTLCMGAALAAFLVSRWFTQMYDAWDTVERGQLYCFKALCYVRYWNVFAMPLLFTGFFLAGKSQYRNCIKTAILLGIVLLFGFVQIIVPIVQTNSSAGSFLYTYLTDETEKVTDQFYYKCILLCILFVFSALAISCTKISKEWAILPILILMIVGYNQANANYNKPVTEKASSMVLASYNEKCRLEDLDIGIGQIYAFDDRDVGENWLIFSVLQFYFYEYQIKDEYPEKVQNNDIIITYNRSEKIETDFPQLKCYQLDDNEVWYTELNLTDCTPVKE